MVMCKTKTAAQVTDSMSPGWTALMPAVKIFRHRRHIYNMNRSLIIHIRFYYTLMNLSLLQIL